MVIDLAKELIRIASVKGDTNALKNVIATAVAPLEGFTVEHFERNGVPSVLVYSGKSRPERFRIIFNAHLDVVPAKVEQFVPFEKEGKLFGRGAVDMKAAAAAEILIFKEMAAQVTFPVGLQLVTDEEVGGFDGTKYQVEQGVRADFVIAGEPTDFGINDRAKGILWAKVIARGTTAHGAYPWQGENALWKLEKFLERLREAYPEAREELWKTTVNLAKIETPNLTFNKVPDSAYALLDVRYVPEDEQTIVAALQHLAGNDATIEVQVKEPPQFTDPENEYVRSLKQVVKDVTGEEGKTIVKHGGSDIRLYNAVGCDGVTFGPPGYGLHTDEEWVSIEGLEQYGEMLRKFLVLI